MKENKSGSKLKIFKKLKLKSNNKILNFPIENSIKVMVLCLKMINLMTKNFNLMEEKDEYIIDI